MAYTVSANISYVSALLRFADIQNQPGTVSILIEKTPAEEADEQVFKDNFTTFLLDLETVSNAKVTAEIEDVIINRWSSDKVPTTALNFALVDQVLALNFERANPLKPDTSKLNKTFPIFAYKVGTASLGFGSAGVPNVANANMAAIITYLTTRLNVRYSGDGLVYGTLAFKAGESGGISLLDIVDSV